MTAIGSADEALRAITSMDWRPTGGNDAHSPSRLELMREHLRRVTLWEGHCTRPTSWPHANLPRAFDPSVPLPEEIHEELVEYFEGKSLFGHIEMLSKHIIHWAVVMERTQRPLPPLPDPYLPLLTLFKRGGEFPIEHRRATFWPWRLPLEAREEYISDKPFVIIDDAALDSLDKESPRQA